MSRSLTASTDPEIVLFATNDTAARFFEMLTVRVDVIYSLGGYDPGDSLPKSTPLPSGTLFENNVFIYHGTNGSEFVDWSDVGNPVVMYGYGGDDALVGGSSDDQLYAGGGTANMLWGGDGDDTLVGGSGEDYISGDDGDDQLHDGDGEDFLLLGGGDDFVFLSDDGDADTIMPYGGVAPAVHIGIDVIDGFVSGVDKLDLFGAGFEDFNDFMDAVTYNANGQVWVDLPGTAALVFTNMTGGFAWDDVIGLG